MKNPLVELGAKIQALLPTAVATLDAGNKESSPWFLDISYGSEAITVEWNLGESGFGVSYTRGARSKIFGIGPAKVIEADIACEEIVRLFTSNVADLDMYRS
jgi:hypothetical protein